MRLSFNFLIATAIGSIVFGEDWPQWRGPLGTGISAEKCAPIEWSTERNISWQVALPGPGNSTPIVWQDKLFLTCASNDGRTRGTYGFDAKTGSELWSTTVEYNDPLPVLFVQSRYGTFS